MHVTRKVKVLVAQSCPTLCNPMDCRSSRSSVHGILQARLLKWEPFPSPGDLPDPGIEPRSPALQVDSVVWATREAQRHLSKSTESITPRVKSRLTTDSVVTRKCQCRFIFGKKCTILVSNVIMGEALHMQG